MDHLKMNFLLNMGIFHCYVCLQEGKAKYWFSVSTVPVFLFPHLFLLKLNKKDWEKVHFRRNWVCRWTYVILCWCVSNSNRHLRQHLHPGWWSLAGRKPKISWTRVNLRSAEMEGTSYLIVDGWQFKDQNERMLRLVVYGAVLFSGLPAAYV